jgi:predicted secreted protein
MNWVSGVVLYAILWCVVLFAVLPWGVRQADPSDLGYAAGAPANPQLPRKLLWTSLITAALWLVIFLVIRADVISFRDWAAGGSLLKR